MRTRVANSLQRGKSQTESDRKFGKGGGHDRLHRRMGPYAVRQARRRDRREPDRAGRQRRARRCRHRRRAMSTRSCSATSMPASRRRISPPRWCCRPRPDLRFKRATRVENACATGSAAVHQGLKAIAAGTARIVLVVGVEQMTTTPARDRQEPAQGVLCARGGRHRGRLRRHLRQDRRRSISSATATSPTRWR